MKKGTPPKLTQAERRLGNKGRRNRDIYNYVTHMCSLKQGTRDLYNYGAVLEMAEVLFYLSPDTIADIMREYVPPPDDPDQLKLSLPDHPPADKPANTLAP